MILRCVGASENQYQKADVRGDQYAGLNASAAAVSECPLFLKAS